MLRRDDPAFKKVVDGAIAALYRSGEGQKLFLDEIVNAENSRKRMKTVEHPDRTGARR